MELLFKETVKEDLIYWKKNNPKILKGTSINSPFK